jgi:hypothetical protein
VVLLLVVVVLVVVRLLVLVGFRLSVGWWSVVLAPLLRCPVLLPRLILSVVWFLSVVWVFSVLVRLPASVCLSVVWNSAVRRLPAAVCLSEVVCLPTVRRPVLLLPWELHLIVIV